MISVEGAVQSMLGEVPLNEVRACHASVAEVARPLTDGLAWHAAGCASGLLQVSSLLTPWLASRNN
jgi:hypothetical protein